MDLKTQNANCIEILNLCKNCQSNLNNCLPI